MAKSFGKIPQSSCVFVSIGVFCTRYSYIHHSIKSCNAIQVSDWQNTEENNTVMALANSLESVDKAASKAVIKDIDSLNIYKKLKSFIYS